MASAELELEQKHVDRAYERLEVLRDEARKAAARTASTPSTGEHALWERDALFSASRARFVSLTIGDDEPLVFGRIDTADRESFHIGRVGVTDEDRTRLVVDWRAPAAEAFYRATSGDPKGVVRRRHLHCRGKRVLGLDDELLDSDDPLVSELSLVGEAALLRAVDRERTGRMRDIVSTIQVEQDRVIRAPIEGILVVQGGPGTGKTAVGLHRAAYLLYTHRHRLERTGVLLVGPDPIFLRYVEQVLPSLGEGSVRLATASELVDGVKANASDEHAAAARVKGDTRMIKVIRAAIRDRGRGVREPVRILYDGELLELTPDDTSRIVAGVGKGRGTHNERRRPLEMAVLLHLLDLYRRESKKSAKAGSRGPAPWGTNVPREERTEFFEAMLETERVTDAIEEMWPILTPQQLLRDLFSDPSALRRATARVLTDDETDALLRPQDHAWTPADVALLDEARVMLGSVPQRAPDQQPKLDEEERWMIERMLDDIQEFEPIVGMERGWMAERYLQDRSDLDKGRSVRQERTTYGHVIVDEAQDLSPMQWRMIARRCPSRSMTILGDLAQASGAWVPSDWEEVLEALRSRREPQVAELTINYRTPAAIMDVADRVIRDVAPGLARPRSVRSGDGPPRFHLAEDPSNLIDEAALIALSERKEAEGTVAVIVPSELVAKMHERLGDDAGAASGDLDAGIVVIDPRRAKGLEFDVVVVVEPKQITDEAGARGLYVTLTRPTQRLVVVHSQELPEALRA